LSFIGNSRIIDPEGTMLAGAGNENETICLADIDPEKARNKSITARNHLFNDRKPQWYHLG
jgi:predicted amidohydrolase